MAIRELLLVDMLCSLASSSVNIATSLAR